jgi:large subunit ribosomal protein L31e
MAEERIYTIPLRKAFSKASSYKRSAKAINEIKRFLMKHMKVDNVKIGKYLNLEIFKNGRKNPPPRIKIKSVKEISKDNISFVKAELINAPFEKVKEEVKKKEAKVEVKESKLEENIEKLQEEKKEVLEHNKVEKKERKTKSFFDKTKPTQEQKISGIIGSTGKK